MKIITPRFAIKLTSTLLAAIAAFAIVTTAVLAFVGNGNFEAGTFASWTKTVFINNGFSAAHGAGGSDLSVIVGGPAVPALSLSDPHTSGNVRYPAYDHYTARINSDTSYTGGGFAKNGNLITQTIPAYIDPVDNLAHIRFTFAAVMVNPVSSPHTAEEKPYFRVRAINTSNGNDVLYDFQSYVNEPGKNWQDGPVFSGSDTWKYKDWNFVDLTPLPGHPVNAGDNVTLEVTAAGCSLGGHPGYVYIDEITDHEIAGPTIRATGPASVNTGSTITYTYNYRNGAVVSVDPTITAIQPTGVTFNAVSDPANCSLSAGTVTCSYTGLPVGGTGSFTISGLVTATGGSQIAHGDYNIAATGFPTLSGETVLTNVSLNTTILSINRADPNPTSASPVTWDVTFASPVSNLSASNLALVNTGLGGTPSITSVNAVGAQPTAAWTVTASTGTGNGTLGLNMANSTGTSPAISNVPFTGQVYTIDHAPPDTSITSQPPDPTNNGNASLGYTGTDGSGTGIASYECKLDGGTFAACAANPQTYSGLADGSHTFQVRAIDNVGNVDPTPAIYTWVVDTAPPDTSITSQPSDPTNSSNASLGYTGTDGSGTGIAGYDCKLDGAAFAACAANPQTYSALADGSHTFQVRAIDNVGNIDPTPASYTWVIDATPPDTSITSQPSDPTNNSNASLGYVGTDTSGTGIASYDCKLDGAAFAACAANPQTYTGLSDGSHTFQVRAIDNVGNIDPTPASYTWVVDTAPPDTSITSQPSDPTNSSSASLGYTGTDNSGSGIAGYECKLDAAAFAACLSNPQDYTGLSDGSHTFQVRAIDNAGNVDPTPASYAWVVDTTPPDTSITSQPPDPTNSGNASIVYVGTDNSGTGIAGYQCKLDAAAFASCPANPQTYTGLADGSHTFQVRAIDNVGNIDSTPAVCTWVVDTVGPTVSIDQAASQPDPTTVSPVVFRAVFSENIAAGFTDSDVTLSGTAGAATGDVTEIAPFDGTTFSIAVDGMTGPGSVIATIAAGVAQDAAGNSNTASTSTDNVVTFTVDTVTTITSDLPDPSTAGDSVTVNYTVTASLGMPSGNVTVADSVSGANCTGTVAAGNCDIVLTTAGTHALTATYAGSGGYNGSSDTESHEVIDPPSVQFSSSTYMEDESQIATITIVRTGDKSGTDIVMFSTANGTATGGTTCSSAVDYVTVTDQPVVFDPSEATKTVNVTICADWLTELDQTVDLSLAGTHVGSPGTAVLTINDTATHFRSETPIIINRDGAASPYPSTITVGGAPNIIGSIRVTLYDLSAELPDDADVLLVGPNGRKFVLMSDSGGITPIDSSSTVTLNFTDWAGAVLPDSAVLTTRDFEPTSWLPVADFPAPAPAGPYNEPGHVLGGSGLQTLAGNFDGSDANGDWNLYVRNDSTGAPVPVGSFAGGWGLEFFAPTAANASISGRVLTAGGVSIRNARVVVTGNSLPQSRIVTTGSFGYFTFEGLTVGETYVVTVNSQRYTFQVPSRVISLVDNIVDADFVANEQ